MGRELGPIGPDLARLLDTFGMAPSPLVAQLVSRWDQLAGPSWSGTAPVQLRDGMLVVEVADGAAASRLRYQIRELLGALERGLGERVVSQVAIRVSRRH
jgi:predicted nucleic acid-binding Zn ribbon protein